MSGQVLVPGQIAQCVGRFPFPNPTPYRLPSNGVQLFSPPNGGRCAGQFSRFYQVSHGHEPKGGRGSGLQCGGRGGMGGGRRVTR